MPGFRIEHLESDSHCFMVARGWPALDGGTDAMRPARDELRVAVHERPTKAVLRTAAQSPPAPVAGMVPFARVAVGEGHEPGRPSWFVGVGGPFDGWLLLKSRDRAGLDRFIGLPWSTCALWRQGRELQALNPPPSGAPPQAVGACAAR